MSDDLTKPLVPSEKSNEHLSQQDAEELAAGERKRVSAALEAQLVPETDPARAEKLARRIIEIKVGDLFGPPAAELKRTIEEPSAPGEDANGLRRQR